MTLILGYAAREFAILASDRMVTWDMTDGTKRGAELMTKSTFFCGQMLFGFTGVAELGGDTSKWLTDELVKVATNPQGAGAARHLMNALARDLGGRGGIAVLSVGYTQVQLNGEGAVIDARPRLVVISNAATERWRHWQVGVEYRTFEPSLPVHAESFRFWAVGSPPSQSRMIEAGERIRRYRRHHRDRCLEIIKTMAAVIVERAQEDPGVGSTVQVTIMPRAMIGQEFIDISLTAFQEPLEAITCLVVNPQADPIGLVMLEGVNLVASNGMAFLSPVISPGSAEFLGPRPPLVPPPA